jgi:cytochrome c oxidase subunit 2
MPITVKVVSQEAYDAWLDWAIDEYGGTRPGEAVTEAPLGAAVAEEPAPPADQQATPTEETDAAIQDEQGLEAEAEGEAEETPAEAAEPPVAPAQ